MKDRKSIRILSALLALTLLLAIAPQITLSAHAAEASGMCGDNLIWSFDAGSGTLTISGYGEMYDYGGSYGVPNDYSDPNEPLCYTEAPWFDFSKQIIEIRLPDGLEHISNTALWGCSNLKSIFIPKKVSYIWGELFRFCMSLNEITVDPANADYTSVDGVLYSKNKDTLIRYPAGNSGSYSIPHSVTIIGGDAFSNCINLQNVTIPNSVTDIGWEAFEGCTGLQSISIPSSVTIIRDSAFRSCSSLASISILGSIKSMGAHAFNGTAYANNLNNWSDGLLYLGNWVIDAQYDLTSANIRPGTIGITGNVFSIDTLKSVTIPEGLEYIEPYAFGFAHQLSSINLPSSLKRIGFDAFMDTAIYDDPNRWDHGLLYIGKWLIEAKENTIVANVRPGTVGIADSAFRVRDRLTTVTLPEGLRYIGENAFEWCTNLTEVSIPDSVTRIGEGAFSGCSSLKNLTIPNSVTSIGEGAFDGCSSLTNLAIPNSVKTIDEWAFAGCSSLKAVIVPDSVTSIGEDAFGWNDNLRSILILNKDCDIYDSENTLNYPEHTTVFGYPGSTAEAYAQKHGYTFKSIEDVSFIDVADDVYYTDPVAWAVEREVTNGTAPYLFSPENTCTRAQVVTFLWRAAGCPEPKQTANPFEDVKEGQYYYKAVLWAVEQGVTNGVDAKHFAPNAGCTRAQVVTFLWRAMGRPMPWSFDNSFTDVDLNEYYGGAVLWAIENGITNGTSANRFSPNATCTRAQIVTFLFRTYEQMIYPIPIDSNLVGVSMPTKDLQRWNQDGDNMKKELEAAGYDVDLQFAANDPSMQISQLENMIANGARVLIVAAIDGDALLTVLQQAKEAGCTVIAYDRPINSGAVSYYVTFDNFAVGAAQGRFIADTLDLANAGNRVYNLELIGGSPDDGNAYVFYDGAMSVLRPYIAAGTLKVLSGQVEFEQVATADWASENAQARYENLLSRYYADKPLHAVLASNDSTAQGVTMALEKAYRNDVYPIITGQDCDIVSVKNMVDDKQAMSIFRDTRILCARTVEMADDIMKGRTPQTNYTIFDGRYTYPVAYCEPFVCTPDKVQSLLIDSGYYTYQDIYG